MFRNMQAIKPGLVRSFDKRYSFVELLRQRPVVGAIDVIEQSKSHFLLSFVFANFPARGGKMFGRKVEGFLLQTCCHRIIKPV
jgi:hypothetical protein